MDVGIHKYKCNNKKKYCQETNTNKTKRNIHRTEAGIQSQAPDLTLHTISTMPGGEDELKEQVEALTVHKDDIIIYQIS